MSVIFVYPSDSWSEKHTRGDVPVVAHRLRRWTSIESTCVLGYNLVYWWHCPAGERRWISVGLTLVQRRRRWTNVKPFWFSLTLVQRRSVRVDGRPTNPSCTEETLLGTWWISTIHTNTRRWPNVDSMLAQRRRRWPNIKSTFGSYFLWSRQRHVILHWGWGMPHHWRQGVAISRRYTFYNRISQSARYIDPMLVQCLIIVYNAGPTLNQHQVGVSWFLGYGGCNRFIDSVIMFITIVCIPYNHDNLVYMLSRNNSIM